MREKEIYKVITESAVVDFFRHIRDSAVIENTGALISYYGIATNAVFMTVCNFMFITVCNSMYTSYCLLLM